MAPAKEPIPAKEPAATTETTIATLPAIAPTMIAEKAIARVKTLAKATAPELELVTAKAPTTAPTTTPTMAPANPLASLIASILLTAPATTPAKATTPAPVPATVTATATAPATALTTTTTPVTAPIIIPKIATDTEKIPRILYVLYLCDFNILIIILIILPKIFNIIDGNFLNKKKYIKGIMIVNPARQNLSNQLFKSGNISFPAISPLAPASQARRNKANG